MLQKLDKNLSNYVFFFSTEREVEDFWKLWEGGKVDSKFLQWYIPMSAP